jgi:hypothetical protein
MTSARTSPLRLVAGSLALLLVVAACGGGDDSSGSTDGVATDGGGTTSAPDPSTSGAGGNAGQPLFMITYEGGFSTPTLLASLGPVYAVTTDGQLIFQGAIPEIFPGPLVPPYEVKDVADLVPDLQEILDRIGIADITEEIDDQAAGNVADASTTVLTYFDENGTHRYGVYALGFNPEAETGDPKVVALNDLMLTLQDASFSGEPGEPFSSDRWQVVVNGDFIPGGDTGLPPDVRPYPLEVAVADFEHTSFGLPCTILEGADAAAAAEVFGDATQATVWDTGTEEIQLLPRPLLPGEVGCEDR